MPVIKLVFCHKNAKLITYHLKKFRILADQQQFPLACLNRKFTNEILQTYLRFKNMIALHYIFYLPPTVISGHAYLTWI